MRKQRQSLPERHLTMNMDQIRDLVIAQLYAYGSIKDSEEVISLEFGYKKIFNTEDGLIPLIIRLKPKEARIRK